jgi:replicative DNA helicase
MLSNLTQIPVRVIKSGFYSSDSALKIDKAIEWIKKQRYTHIYMPTPNLNKIYSVMKRMKYNNELDFVVYDYIKSQGSISSSEVYNMLGNICDFLKNRCCGELSIPMLALAQLNRGGEIADSFRLEQFASTIAVIKRKSQEEIIRDGEDCGNYKLFVKLNRLGNQMSEIEQDYIDLDFNGGSVSFSQAKKQHEEITPY